MTGSRSTPTDGSSGLSIPWRRVTSVTAVLAWLLPGIGEAQDAARVLRTASATYQRVTTLQAAFRQIIINPMLGSPDTATGTLYLLRPDRFAMRFADPEGDRIVADGTWLWMFTPSTVADQVMRMPIPESGAATPNLFAQFVDRPLERYTASHVGEDLIDNVVVDKIRLIPKHADIPFQSAIVYISRSDGMLLAVDLVEESGQNRSLLFHDIVLNQSVPERELEFTPPNGVRVVVPE